MPSVQTTGTDCPRRSELTIGPAGGGSTAGACRTRRLGREVFQATRPFAKENRRESWWHLFSTFGVLLASGTLAALPTLLPLRVLASIVMALTLVRGFILVHDLHHGAIFQESRIANLILKAYGLVLVTPTRIWRSSHNYHHAHTASSDCKSHGAFAVWTVERWQAATRLQRAAHAIERHPLTILFGYVTVFFISFGVIPFARNPRRHLDSAIGMVAHLGLGVSIYLLAGPVALVFAFLVPFGIAGAVGAYLFYVQHAFEGVEVRARANWSHAEASLLGSSYIESGPIFRWFTGNIGFHHVHHLNPKIPFYRLPSAMAAIPELQSPTTVRLSLRTIRRSFQLKLWDPSRGTMVGYRNHRRAPAKATDMALDETSRVGVL